MLDIATSEAVELSDAGAQAIIKIRGGDMRKVLNILESCALSHKSIDAEIVYSVTGWPSSADINELFEALSQKDFNEVVALFMKKKKEKSLSLDDVIGELHKCVMAIKLHDHMK